MSSQSAAVATAADWARLVAVLLSRTYRMVLLALCAVALAPTVLGWASFVIKSGSMEPSIDVGDVVVARPFTVGEKVAVGRVYVFDDPSTSGERLLTHRIVELRDDGSFTSAGDANEVTDATPVTTGDIEARGVLLVPFVGLPVFWTLAGEWVKLGLWLLLTMAAFWIAARDLDGDPPKWGLLRLVRDRFRPDRDRSASGGHERKPALVGRSSWWPVVVGVVLALGGTSVGTAGAGFTAQTRSPAMSWTVASWVQPYVAAVLADAPGTFWLLDEPAGTSAAQDRSGNKVLGTYRSGAALGQPGGLTGNPGTSVGVAGGVALTSANASAAPASHSVELWFRTTAATGGYLIGFGSTAGATSPTEDRVLRMAAGGHLTYGDWVASPVRSITTPRAYNDGAWHHVVVASTFTNFSETTMYVDGVPVVSGQTSKTTAFNGYWRIGGGTGSPAFNGFIDNVSIYGTALPAARVAAHWNAR